MSTHIQWLIHLKSCRPTDIVQFDRKCDTLLNQESQDLLQLTMLYIMPLTLCKTAQEIIQDTFCHILQKFSFSTIKVSCTHTTILRPNKICWLSLLSYNIKLRLIFFLNEHFSSSSWKQPEFCFMFVKNLWCSILLILLSFSLVH